MDWRSKARPVYRFGTRVPPVLRSLLGLVLIGAGVAGIIMPILGLWMAPLGALLIVIDIPPLRRKAQRWIDGPDGAGP
jgi:hypothetical protein